MSHLSCDVRLMRIAMVVVSGFLPKKQHRFLKKSWVGNGIVKCSNDLQHGLFCRDQD